MFLADSIELTSANDEMQRDFLTIGINASSAVLLVFAGATGYAKKGSVASLVMSCLVAAALIYSAVVLFMDAKGKSVRGYRVATCAAAALGIVFAVRVVFLGVAISPPIVALSVASLAIALRNAQQLTKFKGTSA